MKNIHTVHNPAAENQRIKMDGYVKPSLWENFVQPKAILPKINIVSLGEYDIITYKSVIPINGLRLKKEKSLLKYVIRTDAIELKLLFIGCSLVVLTLGNIWRCPLTT